MTPYETALREILEELYLSKPTEATLADGTPYLDLDDMYEKAIDRITSLNRESLPEPKKNLPVVQDEDRLSWAVRQNQYRNHFIDGFNQCRYEVSNLLGGTGADLKGEVHE